MVAWCMGVLPVPGLTAVNGPFLIDCIKLVTGTVVLWGLLSREMGHELTTPLSSDKPNNMWSFPPRLGVHSLRVSQLFARRHSVLLGPAVHAHTTPTCAGAVHLQDVLSWHETHCRGGGEERRHRLLSRGLPLCVRADKAGQSEVLCFTWEGRVDLKAWHTSNLILCSDTVLYPVAGLVYRDEPHWALAEEILAVNQLLNCRGKDIKNSMRWYEMVRYLKMYFCGVMDLTALKGENYVSVLLLTEVTCSN